MLAGEHVSSVSATSMASQALGEASSHESPTAVLLAGRRLRRPNRADFDAGCSRQIYDPLEVPATSEEVLDKTNDDADCDESNEPPVLVGTLPPAPSVPVLRKRALGQLCSRKFPKTAECSLGPLLTFVSVAISPEERFARKFAVILRSGCDVVLKNPPRPLPRTAIGRRACAFLLRLRIDCSRAAERHFNFNNNGSPSCALCPAVETTEHILLQCPGYTEQRRWLFDAYGRLGLSHVSVDKLPFPQDQRSKLLQTFGALLDFFGDADLITHL
ncbi:hypothetical protein HPB51_019165 [Rhipicephalus microplus]|uniref:Tick transposon n=1 Tax=Rhipicephalus microplus TaxID=6941 RepID=A0A9J6DBY3_RHIMP|nr:hypothetical protein HPB51_019165 [Rhipicephalus microplus]